MTEVLWESILEPQSPVGTVSSARLRVPGGWIIRSIATRMDAGVHASQTFVPDPAHEWATADVEMKAV